MGCSETERKEERRKRRKEMGMPPTVRPDRLLMEDLMPKWLAMSGDLGGACDRSTTCDLPPPNARWDGTLHVACLEI
jgi:hypothetical protein